MLLRSYHENASFCAATAQPTYPGCTLIGLATAPHWRGPYTLVPTPIAMPPALHCPTGNLAEDPYLWHDGHRGWHLIAHGLCDWDVHDPSRPDAEDLYAFQQLSDQD